MKKTQLAQGLSNDVARELDELRGAASAADAQLRVLKDLEMGWVAGGDGTPVWPT